MMYYIGANDLANQDTWRWSDNTDMTFDGWCPGRPDPNVPNSYRCGVLNTRTYSQFYNSCKNTWIEAPCAGQTLNGLLEYPFFCNADITPTIHPEPTRHPTLLQFHNVAQQTLH